MKLVKTELILSMVLSLFALGCPKQTITVPYNQPLVISGISPSSGPTAGSTTVQIFGIKFAAGATVSIGGNPATSVTVHTQYHIECVTPAGAAGVADVVVTNIDEQFCNLAGSFMYLGPIPTLSTVNPASGRLSGGTSITLTGTNIQTGATVTLAGAPCTNYVYTSVPASISCDTPSGIAGTATIRLANPDTQYAQLVAGYTYNPIPTVMTINPSTGLDTGGTSVTINGTGFLPNANVIIGGSNATIIVVSSASTITCLTPSHSATVVDVVVTNVDTQSGTLAGGYIYTSVGVDTTPPATITNLSATQGSSEGTVVLTWTAPGDDATTGTAFAYTVKYSKQTITSQNFDSATNYVQTWIPSPGGNLESKTITGLIPGIRYFFALKAMDEVPNIAAISNSVWGLAKCSSLLAYWPFEDGSGSIATDISGNSNHGTLNGCTWLTSGGCTGGAIQLNGSSDYVNTNLIFATLPGGGFTYSIWFKTPGNSSAHTGLIGQWTSGVLDTNLAYRYLTMSPATSNGKIEFAIQGQNGPPSYAVLLTAETYNDNVYHHAVAVYDYTNILLYLDGNLIASASASFTIVNPCRPPLIGAIPDGGGAIHGFLTGIVDEVKVFTCARSGDQIREDYMGRIISLSLQSTYNANGGGFDLTWDGSYLWESDHNSSGNIYKLDSSCNVIQTVNDPGGNCHGLTWDGAYFWKIDRDDNTVYQFNTSGSVITSFAIPTSDTRGIAWDGSSLWVTDTAAKQLHKITNTGSIVSTYNISIGDNLSPLGIEWDGSSFWIAYASSVGGGGSRIVRVKNDGKVLQIIDPGLGDVGVGIAFDGKNIWLARQVGPPGQIHKLLRE